MLLQGKTALITGAANGIGAATARLFAREGARLMLADLQREAGESLAAELRDSGSDAHFLCCDVSQEDQVDALITAAVTRLGHLDCGINNAGVVGRASSLEDTTLDEWQRVLAVDLTGVFLCMKYQLRAMKPRGSGCIVNNASGAGVIATPGLAPYSAAKHAVLGLTKTAAQENARSGIRVNAVLPGSTDTPQLQATLRQSPEAERLILNSMPGGRLGQPGEIAEAIAWLCSDRASFVSGASLAVDLATVCR